MSSLVNLSRLREAFALAGNYLEDRGSSIEVVGIGALSPTADEAVAAAQWAQTHDTEDKQNAESVIAIRTT